MNRLISLFLLLVVCAGCVTPNQVTRTDDTVYPATTNVDVYLDIAKIPPYKEIGDVIVYGSSRDDKELLVSKLKDEAMEQGADGLIRVTFHDDVGKYGMANQQMTNSHAKATMIKYKK